MKYFKINYDKLKNLAFSKIIISFPFIIVFCIIVILIISCFVTVSHKYSTYGIYQNGILTIQVERTLSDKLKNSDNMTFNGKEVGYQIDSYGEYEIIDNNIWQKIYLTIDGNVYDNEVGLVEFYYHKQKFIAFIYELFK